MAVGEPTRCPPAADPDLAVSCAVGVPVREVEKSLFNVVSLAEYEELVLDRTESKVSPEED